METLGTGALITAPAQAAMEGHGLTGAVLILGSDAELYPRPGGAGDGVPRAVAYSVYCPATERYSVVTLDGRWVIPGKEGYKSRGPVTAYVRKNVAAIRPEGLVILEPVRHNGPFKATQFGRRQGTCRGTLGYSTGNRYGYDCTCGATVQSDAVRRLGWVIVRDGRGTHTVSYALHRSHQREFGTVPSEVPETANVVVADGPTPVQPEESAPETTPMEKAAPEADDSKTTVGHVTVPTPADHADPVTFKWHEIGDRWSVTASWRGMSFWVAQSKREWLVLRRFGDVLWADYREPRKWPKREQVRNTDGRPFWSRTETEAAMLAHVRERQALEAETLRQIAAAETQNPPVWESTLDKGPHKPRRMSPEKVLAKWGDQVTFEVIEETPEEPQTPEPAPAEAPMVPGQGATTGESASQQGKASQKAVEEREGPLAPLDTVRLPNGVLGRVMSIEGETVQVSVSSAVPLDAITFAVADLERVEEIPRLYVTDDTVYVDGARYKVAKRLNTDRILVFERDEDDEQRSFAIEEVTLAADMPRVEREELATGWWRVTCDGRVFLSANLPDSLARGRLATLCALIVDESGEMVGRCFGAPINDSHIYWYAAHPGVPSPGITWWLDMQGEGTPLPPMTEEERAFMAAGPQDKTTKTHKTAVAPEGKKSMAAPKVGDIVFAGERGRERAELLGHGYRIGMLAGTYDAVHVASGDRVCQYERSRPAMKRAILADAIERGQQSHGAVVPVVVSTAPVKATPSATPSAEYGWERYGQRFAVGDVVRSGHPRADLHEFSRSTGVVVSVRERGDGEQMAGVCWGTNPVHHEQWSGQLVPVPVTVVERDEATALPAADPVPDTGDVVDAEIVDEEQPKGSEADGPHGRPELQEHGDNKPACPAPRVGVPVEAMSHAVQQRTAETEQLIARGCVVTGANGGGRCYLCGRWHNFLVEVEQDGVPFAADRWCLGKHTDAREQCGGDVADTATTYVGRSWSEILDAGEALRAEQAAWERLERLAYVAWWTERYEPKPLDRLGCGWSTYRHGELDGYAVEVTTDHGFTYRVDTRTPLERPYVVTLKDTETKVAATAERGEVCELIRQDSERRMLAEVSEHVGSPADTAEIPTGEPTHGDSADPVVVFIASQNTTPPRMRVLWRVTRAEAMAICCDDRSAGRSHMLCWTADPGVEGQDWDWVTDNGRYDGLLAELGITPARTWEPEAVGVAKPPAVPVSGGSLTCPPGLYVVPLPSTRYRDWWGVECGRCGGGMPMGLPGEWDDKADAIRAALAHYEDKHRPADDLLTGEEAAQAAALAFSAAQLDVLSYAGQGWLAENATGFYTPEQRESWKPKTFAAKRVITLYRAGFLKVLRRGDELHRQIRLSDQGEAAYRLWDRARRQDLVEAAREDNTFGVTAAQVQSYRMLKQEAAEQEHRADTEKNSAPGAGSKAGDSSAADTDDSEDNQDGEALRYHQAECDGQTRWLYVQAEGVARMLRYYLACDCGGVKLGNFHRSAPAMDSGTQRKPMGIGDASIASADALADRNAYDRVGTFVVVDEVTKRAPVVWRHARKESSVVIDPNSAAQRRALERDGADAEEISAQVPAGGESQDFPPADTDRNSGETTVPTGPAGGDSEPCSGNDGQLADDSATRMLERLAAQTATVWTSGAPFPAPDEERAPMSETVSVPVEQPRCDAHIARDGSQVEATEDMTLGERVWHLCPEHVERFAGLLTGMSQTLTLGGREWSVWGEHAAQFATLLVGALGEPGAADTANISAQVPAGGEAENSALADTTEIPEQAEQTHGQEDTPAGRQGETVQPSVMLTGEVPGYSWEDAQDALRNSGYRVTGRADDTTVLIICGEGAERNATKLRDARERGLPCMDARPRGRFRDAVRMGKFTGGDPLPEPVKVDRIGMSDKERNQAIRAWARRNGYKVPPRGRLSDRIKEAYDRAHGNNPRQQHAQAA
ncbi:histone-like nucleoid-structuring protein Lsr2 [Streptomyces sp. NPDC046215]|uniref:Lsr2 family DNA-binding protein n=1 Tax=Streptomyces sp. NPDC046215 TaxID=3155774 RepID=UPI0033C11727